LLLKLMAPDIASQPWLGCAPSDGLALATGCRERATFESTGAI